MGGGAWGELVPDAPRAAAGGGELEVDPSSEVRTSRIEVRGFLAFGGPPRRHGWTQLEKSVHLDPGWGPLTRSSQRVPKGAFRSNFEVRTSRIEVRGFLAFGGPPRRHGCTQREKLVRLDPGRGPGTDFEPIFSFQCLNSPSSDHRCHC